MLARLTAFFVWALVAATAVFWILRLSVQAPTAPSYAVAVGDSGAARGDLTRLLGATPASAPDAAPLPQASARFRLLGIVAPKYPDATPQRHGLALIAVDGKIPKAYAVGAPIDGELVLQSVSLRTASIGPAAGAATITLELPSTVAAATGALPPTAQNGAYVVPPPATVPRYVPPPPPQIQRVPRAVPPRAVMPPASRVPLQGLAQ